MSQIFLTKRVPIDVWSPLPPEEVARRMMGQQPTFFGNTRGRYVARVVGGHFEAMGVSRNRLGGLVPRASGALLPDGTGTRITGEAWLPEEARSEGRRLGLQLALGAIAFLFVGMLAGMTAGAFAVLVPFMLFAVFFNSSSAAAHAAELRDALPEGIRASVDGKVRLPASEPVTHTTAEQVRRPTPTVSMER